MSIETLHFHCFDTALGCCAIAWTPLGVVGSQLPEDSPEATRQRMLARFPGACETADLPAAMGAAVAGIQALLSGELRDLLEIPLDERRVPPFNRRVHALTRQIPVGQTRSYGELAVALGVPGAARAVGQAEGANPFAPIVPCHRVMGSGGAAVGFSAHGGVETKRRLLAIEARACGQLAGEQGALF
ncbi:methylated-DNA--[protein]-cysteine S-methyltransferase [Paucibacter sp. APW11]|uniref:Methylated-DNA--[protein]-cysteine S-methyltransferase n=1 Tax=Roseateles aquae TaxID=3077235 RepID=A0ABU3P5P5_9BURK|nr:methylated-DNA--[protein]-cysteine S-methyltransferase [Paucibacter sp. APW11]MDT8997893.1 methylated-DNA--[protein]-cysteine S-methyltransferase [Paucibacter sp. APW11]